MNSQTYGCVPHEPTSPCNEMSLCWEFQVVPHFGSKINHPTVDERNPTPGMSKTLVINGINYQPQLVNARFLKPSTSHVRPIEMKNFAPTFGSQKTGKSCRLLPVKGVPVTSRERVCRKGGLWFRVKSGTEILRVWLVPKILRNSWCIHLKSDTQCRSWRIYTYIIYVYKHICVYIYIYLDWCTRFLNHQPY